MSQILADTCFVDEYDPIALGASLNPLGYHQLSGPPNSVNFAGGPSGRLNYTSVKNRQFCRATLNSEVAPDSVDLCTTAIEFSRRLSVMLRQAERVDSSGLHVLKNIEGLESSMTYDEICVRSAKKFSWQLVLDQRTFQVSLFSRAAVGPLGFGYSRYSSPAGYVFGIERLSKQGAAPKTQ